MLDKWRDEWGFLTQIIRVTRIRERLNSKESQSTEVSYYVMNRDLSLAQTQKHIRNHWHIENKLNHVKDVAFQEDKGIRRVNPYIFSFCIDFALNRMRANQEKYIKPQIYENSLNLKKMIKKYKLIHYNSTP